MEVESQQQQPPATKNQISKHLRWFLMALNFAIMVIGTTAGPLLLRLYFLKGGSRKWLSSWLETGGWPLLFIPLAISYAHRRGGGGPTKLYLMTPPLFLACTVLGLLVGLDGFLNAYGLSYLPVSTSSILISTQLGFTALFAFLIVKQKFTSFSTNAVVLLSIGAVMLGLHASGDRPEGESNTLYYLGFAMTLAAAVLYAFILPLVELTYGQAKQVVSYTLVMEMQLVMGFFAAVFCTVGMLVNKDFQVSTVPLSLYAYGMSCLPVSTASILVSTHLGFTALFAFLIVKQKFTSFSTNAVVLLSIGAVILGLHASGDRPKGESNTLYYWGFAMTLAAAMLYGVVLPLVELTYAKARQVVSYTLVMEMQLVMGFFATLFCTVGMLVNKDFQAIPREARDFGLGEVIYYVLLVWSAIMWQFFYLGTVGAIFYGSALLAGIIIAAMIPVTEVLAVILFHEPFSGGKGVALALALWGFASYFYGEFQESKKKKPMLEPRLLDSVND